MVQQETVYVAIIVAYLVVLLGIAIYIAKIWIDDPGDFMLAGREIGGVLSGLSLVAILLSGGFVPTIVLMGYLHGVGGVWFFWGWAFGQGLVMLTWAVFWRRSGAYTPAEYFEYQYGVSGRLAVLLGSLIAMALIGAFQFVGSGVLIAGMLGIDVTTAVIAVGGFTMIYALLSGMWGISISDFIQGIWVMASVFLLTPIYLYMEHGLPSAAASPDITPQMMSWPFGSMEVISFAAGTVITFLWMNWFLANAPYYWVRASATRSEKALKQGYVLALTVAVITGIIGVFLGLWAQMLVDPADPSLAFGLLLAEEVPVWLGGLAASGIIAATMSTVDAIYQGCANTIVRDYVQRFTSITSRTKLLRIAQLTMVATGVVTIAMALSYPGSIDAMIAFAFAFSAPLVMFNLDSWLIRYGTKEAAVLTVLAIIPLVTYWEFFSPYSADIHALWVSGIVSLVFFYGISAVTHVTGPWWTESVSNAGERLSEPTPVQESD